MKVKALIKTAKNNIKLKLNYRVKCVSNEVKNLYKDATGKFRDLDLQFYYKRKWRVKLHRNNRGVTYKL